MRIKDIIAHIFDFHVMKKKNWTLEQLAAWVQTWEPKEEIARPIANALPQSERILPGALLNQWQAEREWQRVLQAFEARHEARRSSPKTPAA